MTTAPWGCLSPPPSIEATFPLVPVEDEDVVHISEPMSDFFCLGGSSENAHTPTQTSMIELRVAEEMTVRLHRRAVYSVFSLALTFGEIACSTGAAFAIFAEAYDASAALSMLVTSLVAVDTALRVKERAAWHHAAYLQLRNINSALIREKTRQRTHPMQEELDALVADAPIDLVASAVELCCKPSLPLMAKDVRLGRLGRTSTSATEEKV